MRPIGFSTGALAYSDFRRGVELNRSANCSAIELSALRQGELAPLLEGLGSLDLSSFSYVSIHAPSTFDVESEKSLCALLKQPLSRRWPIIIHPDAINDVSLWRDFGKWLCIENMDKRKPTGRTVQELDRIFQQLPDASFCFDIGHARQFDPTMTEAYLILREFGPKLCQVHVSEVNTRSKHDALSYGSIMAYQEVAHLIPEDVPLILESVVEEGGMEHEIAKVRDALPIVRHAAAV